MMSGYQRWKVVTSCCEILSIQNIGSLFTSIEKWLNLRCRVRIVNWNLSRSSRYKPRKPNQMWLQYSIHRWIVCLVNHLPEFLRSVIYITYMDTFEEMVSETIVLLRYFNETSYSILNEEAVTILLGDVNSIESMIHLTKGE